MVTKGYDSVGNMDPEPLKSGIDKMLHILLPNYFVDACTSAIVVAIVDYIETTQKKYSMQGFSKVCTCAPPTVIKPREINSPTIPAHKTMWIMHLDGGDVPMNVGKSDISWKAKSSKLGAQCEEGTQWIFVHQVFVNISTCLMHAEGEFPQKLLVDALPPSLGLSKLVKWDSRYLVHYVVLK